MIYSVAFCNHLASFSINPISYITGNPYQSCTLIQTTLDIKQTPPKNKIKTTLLTCIMYDQLYKNMLIRILQFHLMMNYLPRYTVHTSKILVFNCNINCPKYYSSVIPDHEHIFCYSKRQRRKYSLTSHLCMNPRNQSLKLPFTIFTSLSHCLTALEI